MRDILFLFVWGILFPISLWSAHVGVLLWVWVALISPGEQLYGFMVGVPYNKIVAICTLAVLVLNREKKAFYLDSVLCLLAILTFSSTISALGSIVDSAEGWDLFNKFIKIMLLAFVISGVMWSQHRMTMLVVVICLGYGFEAVSQGGQLLATAGGHKVEGTGSVGDNNSLAVAILMIVPLLYYLMQYARPRLSRLVYLGTLVMSILAVMATYSRGGFIGLVVVALMFLKNSGRKLRGLFLIAIFGVLIVVAAPASWYDRLNTLNNTGEDSSFMERVTVWKVSTLIALDHPLFGGGFHAVQTWPVWTKYIPQLPRLDFITTPPPDPTPRAAHSTYFEILGDLGFVGLGTFLSILGISVINCSRIRRLARGRLDLVWAADMAQMIQISLVVYAVTTIALSMGYFEGLYIFIALSSRLLRTVRQTIAGTLPAILPVYRPVSGLQGGQTPPITTRSSVG